MMSRRNGGGNRFRIVLPGRIAHFLSVLPFVIVCGCSSEPHTLKKATSPDGSWTVELCYTGSVEGFVRVTDATGKEHLRRTLGLYDMPEDVLSEYGNISCSNTEARVGSESVHLKRYDVIIKKPRSIAAAQAE